MDYEEILFGLQPIINAADLKDIPIQDVYLESYLTVLDQLAVSLRAPDNRNVVGQTGLFLQLLRVLDGFLDVCFHHDRSQSSSTIRSYFKLASELIRCVANCLVDNDTNRKLLVGENDSDLQKRNQLLDYYASRIFNLDVLIDENHIESDDSILSTLQMRTIVLLKNLILENEQYTTRFSKSLRGSLINILQKYQNVYLSEPEIPLLASEVLSDILEVYSSEIKPQHIDMLILFLVKLTKTLESMPIDDDEDDEKMAAEADIDDPNVDLLINLTKSLESIVKNEKLSFKDTSIPISKLQKNIFQCIENLHDKEFYNRLIVMRGLSGSIGHISANLTVSNIEERDICYEIIKNSNESYQIAAAFIVLSNSISSKNDADTILNQIPFSMLIEKSKLIKDPMQFQGFLDLLRKCLSISSVMFISFSDLKALSIVLKLIQDQSKYFTNLSPLLISLINKLITVLSTSNIQKLISENKDISFLDIVLASESLSSAITLNKLLISNKTTDASILEKLWCAVFKFKDSSATPNQNEKNISINYLFQVSKTLGIYFKNLNDAINADISSSLLSTHPEDIKLLLETIKPLKDQKDKGAESVFNNGKFVAGMILQCLTKVDILTPEETSIQELSKSFF